MKKKISSFSTYVIVMKKKFHKNDGIVSSCVRVHVWCSTSSAKSKIMGENGMSHKQGNREPKH